MSTGAEQPGDGAAWRSLHVAYYDDNKDALIGDAIAPLFDKIDVPKYFVRHWRRGPHVRLNFYADDDAYTRVIRPLALEIVESHLSAHPSRKHLDPQQLLPMHRRHAEIDSDHGPLTPWYPDNTIHDAPYDGPVIGFSGESSASFTEDFYSSTSDLVFDTVRRVRSGQSRLGLLFDVWVATAHALSGAVDHGWISYRSHAEFFRLRSPDPAGRLRAWDERYAQQMNEFATRASVVLETIDHRGSGSPVAQDWLAAMRPVRERARGLIDEGRITFPAAMSDDGAVPDMVLAGKPLNRVQQSLLRSKAFRGLQFRMLRRKLSPFHQALLRNDDWATFSRTPEFLTYRVVLTFTYAHASRVGITLPERFFLCHLVATTMEQRYGVDSAELASGLVLDNNLGRTGAR